MQEMNHSDGRYSGGFRHEFLRLRFVSASLRNLEYFSRLDCTESPFVMIVAQNIPTRVRNHQIRDHSFTSQVEPPTPQFVIQPSDVGLTDTTFLKK